MITSVVIVHAISVIIRIIVILAINAIISIITILTINTVIICSIKIINSNVTILLHYR